MVKIATLAKLPNKVSGKQGYFKFINNAYNGTVSEKYICIEIVQEKLFRDDVYKRIGRSNEKFVGKGLFGFEVFICNDLLATYEELKSKGVEFKMPPIKEFYGFKALLKDDSGNWLSLSQKQE